jgi:hypothetical protein
MSVVTIFQHRRLRTWALLAAVVAFCLLLIASLRSPPPEPTYQGMTLRQWIRAEPHMPITSHEDICAYRRNALKAMGAPAIRYLHWMISHPGENLEDHVSRLERWRLRVPVSIQRMLPAPTKGSTRYDHVVFAAQLLGPDARDLAPDIARLWGDAGNRQYASYNGFPLTLAELGNSSPIVMQALDRHARDSGGRIGAFSIFAMWQLKPTVPKYIDALREELKRANELPAPPLDRISVRESLVSILSRRGTNALTFAPEIRAVAAKAPTEQSALASFRILSDSTVALLRIKQVAAAATNNGATRSDVDRFSAEALALAEVPEVDLFVIPLLREFSAYKDPSSARFASNILVRIEQIKTTYP